MIDFVPLSRFDTVARFRDHLAELGIGLEVDTELGEGAAAPLAGSLELMGRRVGNRFCVHPMEGWDADVDGRPTRQSRRRWQALGRSGAKMLWNESVAVNPLGRSSPEQLLIAAHTVESLAAIRREQVGAHVEVHGGADDLLVGIQLTHSGRYSKPGGRSRPVAVRRHPLFDETIGPGGDSPLLSDAELRTLIGDYVRAAQLAQRAGFDFVDIKSCHGYLSHELLGAFERTGDFGGSLVNRTRLLREIVAGIRDTAPGLGVAVRLNAFDTITHEPDENGVGRPITDEPFRYWFGTDATGHHIDLGEPVALLEMLRDLSVGLVSITGSSPYSAHHYQTPTAPASGERYINPENPLYGVARHLAVTAALKASRLGGRGSVHARRSTTRLGPQLLLTSEQACPTVVAQAPTGPVVGSGHEPVERHRHIDQDLAHPSSSLAKRCPARPPYRKLRLHPAEARSTSNRRPTRRTPRTRGRSSTPLTSSHHSRWTRHTSLAAMNSGGTSPARLSG